ncbi:MAG: penicillin-binding protein 2 [Sphaerochaeta sp.]
MATSPNRSYYRFFIYITLLATLILLARIGYIIHAHNPQRKNYDDPVVSPQVIRGTIYDRNGKILAIQTPYWGVYFHLNAIDDLQLVSEVVSPYVGMSPDQIQAQAANYTTYAQIKRKINDDQVEPLRLALQRTKLQNQVSIQKSMGRSYPALFHASQTIGFTNTDNEGLEGIEYTQQDLLSPYPQVGTDEPTYGQDITLTLDIDIQYLLDLQLQHIADEHNPDYGIALVLDANNADILGMSSYPWYDPNSLFRSTEEQKRNHVVNHLYEPGSVFKIFSLAAVMEANQADLLTPFECDGTYTFDSGNGNKTTINCTEPHGTVDPKTMIQKSCNGAIVHWALQTDEQEFASILDAFGFNSRYDIDLPSQARSHIATPDLWSGRSQATISFGQELSTTALHLGVAATSFTNGGDLLLPHLILRTTSLNADKENVTLYERERTIQDKVISKEVAQEMLAYMHSASESGGTGIKAAVEGISIGVKTGTAQILNPVSNSYEDGTVLASTLAIVPIENPKYIIYIAAGNPKGNTIWGSNIASPAIGEIIKALVSQGKLISDKSPIR